MPGETIISVDQNDPVNNHRWFVGCTETDARSKAAIALNVAECDVNLVQDEDVLDTWFSSGILIITTYIYIIYTIYV